jgi:pseudouridine-5'-phosphate glycosidase
MSAAQGFRVHAEVADALAAGRPVVALESAIVAHGLPWPQSLPVARELEAEVRAGGAVPATIAVVDGVALIGLSDDELELVARGDGVHKASVRDLAVLCARGATGATTVAATAHLAALAGVGVFATGGLGGVHRGARETWDESADLAWLARTPSSSCAPALSRSSTSARRSSAWRPRASRCSDTGPTASPASTSPIPAFRCRGASSPRRRSRTSCAHAR